jgi:hypothetical protein
LINLHIHAVVPHIRRIKRFSGLLLRDIQLLHHESMLLDISSQVSGLTLGRFDPYFERALRSFTPPVSSVPHNMIPHRVNLYTPACTRRVFLKGVTFTRNIRRNLNAITQAYTRDLA